MSQVEANNYSSQNEINHSVGTSPENPSTLRSIKVDEDQANSNLIIQLKEQLKSKIQELAHKDTIINELEEKCEQLHDYEDKIASLQAKTTALQKIIDNLEKTQENYQMPDKNQPIIECDEYHVSTDNPLTEQQQNLTSLRSFASKEQVGKQKQSQEPRGHRKQGSKQNRKSSLKPRDNNPKVNEENVSGSKSRNHARISSQDGGEIANNLSFRAEQIVSSKFLNAAKQESEKNLQIQMKFDKMKENLGNKKPKSNKNIQQIYSILNNYNSRKEQLAIKGINQKLQTILNQSVKLQTSAVKQRDSSRLYCNTDRPMQQNSSRLYCNTDRPMQQNSSRHYNAYPTRLQSSRERKDSFGFNSTFINLNSSMNSTSSRGYHNKTDRIQPKGSSWVASQVSNDVVNISNKLGNQKFNKIMNSFNVEDMLRARRTCSIVNPVSSRSSVNRTVGYTSGVNKYSGNMYWA